MRHIDGADEPVSGRVRGAHELGADRIEHELGPTEHLEAPAGVDAAPAEVQKAIAPPALHKRSTEVERPVAHDGIDGEAPRCRRDIAGHLVDDLLAALHADVHVLVDQAAGPGIGARPARQVDADDLHVHVASVPDRLITGDTLTAVTHNEVVRTEFARQAAGFAEGSPFADPRLNGWVRRHLEPLMSDMVVLEVACGAAHQAQAVAERVRQVVGVDLTPEMLETGRRRLADAGVRNVLLEEGNASALPFVDGSFDLAYSRFALHHVEDPAAVLTESTRVIRSGGRVAVIDLVSSDPELADRFNDYERRRDPSHTRALTPDELASVFASAGLEILHRTRTEPMLPVDRWLAQASTPTEIGNAIVADLRAELAGGPATGMRPVDQDGTLSYTQTWEIVVARAA
jgi:SAM-dependent methyltransferase